jgi:hypothetical protein
MAWTWPTMPIPTPGSGADVFGWRRAPDSESDPVPRNAHQHGMSVEAGKIVAVKWTQDALAMSGFSGFVRLGELPAAEVPIAPGVYVVVRPAATEPEFLKVSPAGWFKGKDPSVALSALESAWVPGSPVVYIGKASGGSTGRRGLRKRLDEYRRHGAGEPVGHWGGRYIWQLADSRELLVGWRSTAEEDARTIEREMIVEFSAAHGKRPFANLTG